MKPTKLLTGDALVRRAHELGVVTTGEGLVTIPGSGTVAVPAPEYEIQRRVLEAERHLREHRLWLFAMASAIASGISALAAWFAILK